MTLESGGSPQGVSVYLNIAKFDLKSKRQKDYALQNGLIYLKVNYHCGIPFGIQWHVW